MAKVLQALHDLWMLYLCTAGLIVEGGPNSRTGVFEMSLPDQSGAICVHRWMLAEAATACRQLGLVEILYVKDKVFIVCECRTGRLCPSINSVSLLICQAT